MSIEPLIRTLPPIILGQILIATGELSNTTRVCKLFKSIAGTACKQVEYQIRHNFGLKVLVPFFQNFSIPLKLSSPAKIDAFFWIAQSQYHADPALPCYDPARLNGMLSPYLSEMAYQELWNAIFKEASGSLKQRMSEIELFGGVASAVETFLRKNQKELKQIKGLHLKNLQLHVLPKEIDLLTHLEVLDLSGNALSVLPSLASLKNLKILNLSGNRFSNFPETLASLSALRILDFSYNRLKQIGESIGNLSELRTLYLNGNHLKNLPSSIKGLISLQILSVENNHLSSFPETLGQLSALQRLYLYHNSLTMLPASFSALKGLLVLSLASNSLTVFPSQITALDKLEVLVLDDNDLSELPEDLKKMKHLKKLFVSDNPRLEIFEPQLAALKCFGHENGGVKGTDAMESETYAENKGQKSKESFLQIYKGLGHDKWKECIEGIYHHHGKWVFDQGLHHGPVEPGYLSSLENLFTFLGNQFGKRIDARFYLKMHKIACAHFKGGDTETLIDYGRTGKFRNQMISDPCLHADFIQPAFTLTEAGQFELYALNTQLERDLGPSFTLGSFQYISSSPVTWRLGHQQLSAKQIKIVFNYFITEFYSEIERAQDKEHYLRAIAKLIQRIEWLHPPLDGSGRVNFALLGFLLASYEGCTPVLLEQLFVSQCSSLDEWENFLKQGMLRWEQERFS